MWARYYPIIIPLTVFVVIWGVLLAWPRPPRRARLVLIPVPRIRRAGGAFARTLTAAATSSRPGGTPGPLSEPSGATGAGPAQRPADGPESPGAALALPGVYDGTPETLYGALRDAEGWEPGRFEGRSGPAADVMLWAMAAWETVATDGRYGVSPHQEMAAFEAATTGPDAPWNTVYPCEWCARHTPNGPQCGACNLMTCAGCLRCPYQDDHDDQAYTRRATEGELAAYRTPADTWAADLETSIRGWHLEHGHTRMPWESTSFPAINDR